MVVAEDIILILLILPLLILIDKDGLVVQEVEEEMEPLNLEMAILHLCLPHKVITEVLEHLQVDLEEVVEQLQQDKQVNLLETLVLVEQELLLILQVLQ